MEPRRKKKNDLLEKEKNTKNIFTLSRCFPLMVSLCKDLLFNEVQLGGSGDNIFSEMHGKIPSLLMAFPDMHLSLFFCPQDMEMYFSH